MAGVMQTVRDMRVASEFWVVYVLGCWGLICLGGERLGWDDGC